MGMDVGGKGGGVKSDINVTPLVDIVLVLLIIFIVITPAVNAAVKLPVAKHSEKPQTQQGAKYLNLMLGRDNEKSKDGVIVPGYVMLDDEAAKREGKGVAAWDMSTEDGRAKLVKYIKASTEQLSDKRVFVKADADLPYKYVDKLFQICREGGADEASIVTSEDKAKEEGK
ncbi:MAG: biopolymer transporter ExbD [Firmicutes bacterium]|nr:biopolymer transporter ExbD [Bacillota bacterium]